MRKSVAGAGHRDEWRRKVEAKVDLVVALSAFPHCVFFLKYVVLWWILWWRRENQSGLQYAGPTDGN